MTENTPPDDGPDPRRWRALSLCLVAGFMTLLDVSIVNVALPSIEDDLGAAASQIQWIVAGYALAFGMVLVPAGRLGDASNSADVFAFGLAGFTLASAACGFAPTAQWLVAFRIIQGLAAGFVSPQVSGFLQTMFRGKERAKAFGLFGMTVGISTAIGPLLGGLLVTTGGEHGWRWVFLVNAPVGLVALTLVRRLLPESTPRQRQSLDPVGVLLFAVAVLLAMYPLVEGEQASLGSRPWWLLAPAAALVVGFAGWERQLGQTGPGDPRRDAAGAGPLVRARRRVSARSSSPGSRRSSWSSLCTCRQGSATPHWRPALTQTPFAVGRRDRSAPRRPPDPAVRAGAGRHRAGHLCDRARSRST